MKKFMITISIVFLMFSLVSCKKLVNIECANVEVTIVDKYHRAAYTTPVHSGKVTTMITHPAVYRITVEYRNVKYKINGKTVYDKYKDKVGQTATGTLEIRTYNDGSVKYIITGLE